MSTIKSRRKIRAMPAACLYIMCDTDYYVSVVLGGSIDCSAALARDFFLFSLRALEIALEHQLSYWTKPSR